ncbi:MAG: hypothetical protein VX467_03710 [Verrucomicrobiota bacterium]|jgi:hypothetical protein|nr:hypothetical protein [Verrucomicrobiota bacterium]
MKKVDMDYDHEIDRFLKCENNSVSCQFDESKLASEILTNSKTKTPSFPFIYFGLPLAACLVVFFGLIIQRNELDVNLSIESESVQSPAPSFAGTDLLPREIEILDEWLLASPESIDFFSVDFDSSYELLVSLETIPLP